MPAATTWPELWRLAAIGRAGASCRGLPSSVLLRLSAMAAAVAARDSEHRGGGWPAQGLWPCGSGAQPSSACSWDAVAGAGQPCGASSSAADAACRASRAQRLGGDCAGLPGPRAQPGSAWAAAAASVGSGSAAAAGTLPLLLAAQLLRWDETLLLENGTKRAASLKGDSGTPSMEHRMLGMLAPPVAAARAVTHHGCCVAGAPALSLPESRLHSCAMAPAGAPAVAGCCCCMLRCA